MIYTLLYIFGTISCLSLGLVVFLRNPLSKRSKWYLAAVISATLWQTFTYMDTFFSIESVNIWFHRAAYAFSAMSLFSIYGIASNVVRESPYSKKKNIL